MPCFQVTEMKKRRQTKKTSRTVHSLANPPNSKSYKSTTISEVQTDLPARSLADWLPDEATALERQHTEAELRRLSTIVRNSNDAVTIQTILGEILAWNRGAELMYGYTEAEALGMNIQMLIPNDSRQEAVIFADRVAAGKTVDSFETNRLTKDGRTIHVWLTVTVLLDVSGKPEAIATTERDITPVKQAEETIRIQQAELAHMSRVHVVGEFAAAMAHELNQPLCAIGINAQAAQRMIDANLPMTEVKEALSDILENVGRATRVVQGLKDQLRSCEPEYSTLDINEVVSGIAPIAEALGRCENANVVYCLDDSLQPVFGDRIQLQQVLLNLIRNALDAMVASQSIRREIFIETNKCEDGVATVSVRDCGVGIPDDVAEHIFEPFFTTKPEGMGMGLAICSSIITAHRGRFWASQNTDCGCTFHFSLPCNLEACQS